MDPNQIYAILVALWVLTVAGFVTRVVRAAREHERKRLMWEEAQRELRECLDRLQLQAEIGMHFPTRNNFRRMADRLAAHTEKWGDVYPS